IIPPSQSTEHGRWKSGQAISSRLGHEVNNRPFQLGEIGMARPLFGEVPSRNLIWFTTMIDRHAKRQRYDVCDVFLGEKDLVSWFALIAVYVHNGQPNEVVEIFFLMQSKNIRLDEFVMVILISACPQLARWCLVRWIGCYAVEGLGIVPDVTAFPIVLAACSHARSFNGGFHYFERKVHRIAARRLFIIKPNNAGNYILLSNIYVAARTRISCTTEIVCSLNDHHGQQWNEV
ncbi:hypothetical protein EJ110_NYTH03778, partial [Nymphaea thermarum]